MPERIPQSTVVRIPLYVVLNTDHLTPATGKTISVTISKNGGAFGNPSVGATNATEIANGWYYYDTSTTDTGTLGPLIVRGVTSPATTDEATIAYNVVNATTGGLTALPDALPGATNGLFIAGTNAATTVTTSFTTTFTGNLTGSVGSVTGAVGSVTGAVGSVTGNVGGNVTGSVGSVAGNVSGNVTGSVGSVVGLNPALLDVAVSTRLAAGSYTAPDNAGITAIQAQTDLLTFSGDGVDANIASVNEIEVIGNGAAPTWGPA